jgi:hypothetical protein
MMTPAGEPITARKEGVMGVERDVFKKMRNELLSDGCLLDFVQR